MFEFKKFEDLSTRELFDIYKLRVDTFVVEQQCAYPEVDDSDLVAVHVLLKRGDALAAYARIIPGEESHIGRVIVAPDARGQGFAKIMMQEVLAYIAQHYPDQVVHLQGQAHLEPFYSSFGFVTESPVYFEDMIPHVDMYKRGNA